MEDFKIKNNSRQFYGNDLYICKKDGKIIIKQEWYNGVELNGEELKDWLEEALKTRYEVKNRNAGDWDVWDTEENVTIARYFARNYTHAKNEAEKLCERLNRGCD